MRIKNNDIISIYVAFVDIKGGKQRPVLVIENTNKTITFLKITTKFANKSPKIKANYYPIIDWQKCGLSKKSYIDTGLAAKTEKRYLEKVFKIGELGLKDLIGLENFQNNKFN